MSRLRACVLGATGMVGQHFVRILSGHPTFEPVALTASNRSVGKEYSEATDWIVSSEILESVECTQIIETTVDKILSQDIDLVFSALPSGVAYDVEARLAREGLPVFSNAGAHRMDSDVPILIPEINPEHLELVRTQTYGDGFIVTNSNCSTSGLVFGLKPLQDLGIKSVTVSTYQAVSGAGRMGVSSMDILGNVIPHIDNEEEKMIRETKEILGCFSEGTISPAVFHMNVSCARVPVLDGHLESVMVDMDEKLEIEEVSNLLSSFSGEPQVLQLPTAPENPIVVIDEIDRPQPRRDLSLSTKDLGMSVKIGRLRYQEQRLGMFLLVHNTIRGAAGASVLNAEFALAKGVFG